MLFKRHPPIDAIELPEPHTYLSATRHPWPSFIFLLPLLLAYEVGVLWLGGANPEALRNGADTWLHWGLEAFGLQHLYWAPVLVIITLLLWSWRRRDDQPRDVVGTCSGMALESIFCALGLWGFSRCLGPALDHLGITLDVPPELPAQTEEAVGQLITFVGAGIYEELLFRLLLFSAVIGVLRLVEAPAPAAVIVATLASALSFAVAHHVGPYGEAFDAYVFLFRSLAGLYFTLLFLLRGFGVAVGAHACYDVFVGIAVGV